MSLSSIERRIKEVSTDLNDLSNIVAEMANDYSHIAMRTHYEVYKVIHTGVFDGIHDYIYLNKGEYKSLPGEIRKAEKPKS